MEVAQRRVETLAMAGRLSQADELAREWFATCLEAGMQVLSLPLEWGAYHVRAAAVDSPVGVGLLLLAWSGCASQAKLVIRYL